MHNYITLLLLLRNCIQVTKQTSKWPLSSSAWVEAFLSDIFTRETSFQTPVNRNKAF